MGRRALIIALAAFLVIAVGVAITLAILFTGGAPIAGPDPDPTTSSSPQPTASATPSPTPSTGVPGGTRPAPIADFAAQPAPHEVRLAWSVPADEAVTSIVVVRTPGATPPVSVTSGTLIGTLPPTQVTFVDPTGALSSGTKVSYSVFARDAAGSYSDAAAATIVVPAALTITPVKVVGTVTQTPADGTLADAGSFAFTAFAPAGPRTVSVSSSGVVTGAVTTTLTEPAGAAPGAVAWSFTVPNAATRSLAEGAKRDEVFALRLSDGPDSVVTNVTVTVIGINDAPVLLVPLPGQAAIAGQPFTFPIPAGTFGDVDATDTLTLSAGTLPAWLSFTNDQLIGNPSGGDTGTTTVTITATDPHGSSVSADVAIDVATPLPAPNQAPVPVADAVTFDLGVDPLQTSANVLANDTDPDAGPNALAVVPAASEWQVNGELAGTYTLDAAGELVLDSGIDANGPLQRLGAGEQVTGTITYAVTDGTETVESSIEVTVVGAPAKDGEYGVNKAFVPPAEPGRELGRGIHA